MHSAPDPLVLAKIFSAIVVFQPGYLSKGNEPTVALDHIGTMLSPCSPKIIPRVCVGAVPSCSAINEQNRIVSNCVPSPNTCVAGSPSFLAATKVKISTGLDTTRTLAVGFTPTFFTSSRIPLKRSVLRLMRSNRDSSGLRRSPAVMQMISDEGMCS